MPPAYGAGARPSPGANGRIQSPSRVACGPQYDGCGVATCEGSARDARGSAARSPEEQGSQARAPAAHDERDDGDPSGQADAAVAALEVAVAVVGGHRPIIRAAH